MDVSAHKDKDLSQLISASRMDQTASPPPGLIAIRLADLLNRSERPICYVARSENAAANTADAVAALFPEIELVVLPPWDCLPYDRIPPSRHCMGLRMDALRIWNERGDKPKLLLTSVEAALQHIPPTIVIANSQFSVFVGQIFNRDAFREFVRRTGYVEEGVADDPGELAVRDGVIDIYPGGAPGPMRIVLDEHDNVLELRGFDRQSQRTESYLESVVFGPASEAILTETNTDDLPLKSETMERLLLRFYEDMPTLFDTLGDAAVVLGPGASARVDRHLDIIEDAYRSRNNFGESDPSSRHSLYLDRAGWDQRLSRAPIAELNCENGGEVSLNASDLDPRNALVKFAEDNLRQGRTIVVVGRSKTADALYRRLARKTRAQALPIDCWEDALQAEPGCLLKLACELEQSFIDASQNIAVIAADSGKSGASQSHLLLAEPELRIGDLVVHEDHGIGRLKGLESIGVEGVPCDAARLEYRDGSSVLVPMEEFGKLWRYGSEAEAVTLDRLHTEAWQKKREKIGRDIKSTARHFSTLAKQRQTAQAEKFAPPGAAFSAFTRRFPFAETADQAEAIKSVLSDLASGSPMNRLVCGDVGFGKTEIALRAAAAVALPGAQVAVIAPTTVLARQQFATFERRFAGTGISVGMLSRLVKPGEAKRVKSALAEGKIGIIIATQAILAKDIRFSNLALLIVDEEHRFGLKEKRAMNALAPSLHSLAMSATPIPRTLQLAMAGVQEVSLLTTPPLKRRPVRTSLAPLDHASIRTGLMRENRRGGQSFIVVPRIEEIEEVCAVLKKIVPELSVTMAHGKMPAAAIDEAIVSFAEGEGDILLATNIIENGLDVPRANTLFVWDAEKFGLAQLHQLRGRVGRAGAQGMTTLLTDEEGLSEETRLRLSTLVEQDRLGSGLAISMRDLDLRGGGDIAGEDQAGHIKAIGVGLYQKLLGTAVAKLRKNPTLTASRAILNIGISGSIPAEYISDPAVRLNLYGKLLRASTASELDELEEEFEDRFGEPPSEVLILLRTTRLQLAAGSLGIARIEGGIKALAMTLSPKVPAKTIARMTKHSAALRREDRLIFEQTNLSGEEQLRFFEAVVSAAGG